MEDSICYLVQAYADYNAFKKLCNRLLMDEYCHIMVHLDIKSNLEMFYIDSPRVHFIEKREFVSWAGYNQGKLIFNLIDYAMNYSISFDYYCFLSESDYPIYNELLLKQRIIECKNIFLNCSVHQPNKIQKYWIYDINIKSPKINKVLSHVINDISEIFYRCGIIKKSKKVIIDNCKCDVYFSSPFWKYSLEEIQYIDNTFKRNPQIEKYFKYSFAPCELMVSTIIANSKYKENVCYVDHYENLNQLSAFCFFKYDGPRVNVLVEDDYEEIINSQKPFMRKIKDGMSDMLLKKLDEYNEYI